MIKNSTKSVGFNLKNIDDLTVVVDGIAKNPMVKKNKGKKNNFRKVIIKIFSSENLKRIQEINKKMEQTKKTKRKPIKDSIAQMGRFLMAE